jgi:hypothetical protein
LRNPDVDALLFKRIHAAEDAPDKWVAVLNLLLTAERAYWNRFHELSHRVAEPSQGLLPFRRQKQSDKNAVESLIDSVAGEIAYHRDLFRPIVSACGQTPLSLSLVGKMKGAFAPTSSLLATTNAAVKFWPHPALALVAEVQGRRSNAAADRALRVNPQARNTWARDANLFVIPNMRVPRQSVVYAAFLTGVEQNGIENCSCWTTSTGKRLPNTDVYISARPVNSFVYCVMSLAS